MPCVEGSAPVKTFSTELPPCGSLRLALTLLHGLSLPGRPSTEAPPSRCHSRAPSRQLVPLMPWGACPGALALALPAHRGCTLLPGRLKGAGPELGLQVPRAVVLAVTLQEMQGLQVRGRLWGQRGGSQLPQPVLPASWLPAPLLTYLAAIRARGAALHAV